MATFRTRRNEPAEQPAQATVPASDNGAMEHVRAVESKNRSDSVIGSELVITGDVKSSGDVRVDGTIKGDVDCASLTISQGGSVEGGITAEKVVIHGRASGSIKGRSVMLHQGAHVEADIRHQGIGIEMGTRYDGSLKWVDDAELEGSPAAPAPTPLHG